MVERQVDLAGLVAKFLPDPCEPAKVKYSSEDDFRFRIMMIADRYADGNNAADLRDASTFKLALERDPETGAALYSQPTISRMEDLADTRALIRVANEMVRFYCASFARAPQQIVLDIDDTFDAVDGHQQFRLFNAYYDEYGFQPIVVFHGEGRLLGVVLPRASCPFGKKAADHIRRRIRVIRCHWPTTAILPRTESHYGTPKVLSLCDSLGLRDMSGLSKNARLREHLQTMEASTAERYARKSQILSRFKTFSYAARSWSKTHRFVDRVKVGALGRDSRFIVTNLTGPPGKHFYEKLYSVRG